MSTNTETNTCPICDETLDENTDRWSNVREEMVCEGCIVNEGQYSSTLWLIEPDGEVTKVYANDLEVMSEYGDHIDEPVIRRHYTSTDAWRGYYTTTVEDYVEVETGWTTGGWGDPTADRKQTFNDWAEQVIQGDEHSPVRLALTFDPTSNVFSTAVGVLVHKDDVEAFQSWLGEDTARALHDSLT